MNASPTSPDFTSSQPARRHRFQATLAMVFVLGITANLPAQQASIHGRVTGHDEHGENPEVLAGATVEFLTTGDSVAGSATTNENGYYSISDLGPQRYRFRVKASGYLEYFNKTGFELAASENPHVMDFILTKRAKTPRPRPATLHGTVFGLTGDQRSPIEGASVILKDEKSDKIKRLSTDDQGKYQTELAPGDWQAAAVADGYERDLRSSSISIAAGGDETVDFELVAKKITATIDSQVDEAGLSIHGRIFGQDEKGNDLGPIEGARIAFAGSSTGSATTNNIGYYLIESVKPGKFEYHATASGYLKQQAGINVSAKSGVHVLDLILTKGTEDKPAPALLAGRVLEDAGGQQIPIMDAVVKLDHLDTPASMDLPVSKPLAAYRGEEMDPGQWRASVTAPGFQPYAHPSAIALEPGEEKRQDFILKRVSPDRKSSTSAMVSVETTAETPGGTPQVQFVNVMTGEAIDGEIQTDGAGGDSLNVGETTWKVYVAYPKSELPAGEYQAVAKMGTPYEDDYEDDTNGPKQVDPKTSTVFNLTLRIAPPKPALLAGLVVEEVDGQQQIIPDAEVTLAHIDLPISLKLPMRKEGNSYRYVGEDMDPGQWRASVTAPGFKPYTHATAISLEPGEQKRQDFVLERVVPPADRTVTAMVSVKMTETTEGKPKVTFVNVQNPSLVIDGETTDDSAGASVGDWNVLVYYPIRELPAGEYRAEAKLADYDDDTDGPKSVDAKTSTVFNLTLRIAPPEPAMIAGRVFEEEIDGPVIPDAVVKLDYRGLGVADSKPLPMQKANGVFRYLGQDMAPGRWGATVTAPGFELYSHPSDISLKPGEQKRQDFVLKRLPPNTDPTTSAMVSVEMTADTVGTPEVQFVNVKTGLAIDGKTHDYGGDSLGDGESDWKVFVFYPIREPLPQGEYLARAKQANYTEDTDGPKPVDPGKSTVFNLTLRPDVRPVVPPGGLWVTVFLQYGDAKPERISYATVALRNERTGDWPRIDDVEDGDYYADDLDAGQYSVAAKIDGVRPASRTVAVVAGRDSKCEIIIKVQPPQVYALVGVPSPQGRPPQLLATPGGQTVPKVQFFTERGGAIPANVQGLTPDMLAELGRTSRDLPEGLFRWFIGRPTQPVAPGNYYAEASLAGYESRNDRWQEAKFGQKTAFMILLPMKTTPVGSLLVKVEDEEGQPLRNAIVRIINITFQTVLGKAEWDNDLRGYFTDKVPPGAYSVIANPGSDNVSVAGWDLVRVSPDDPKVDIRAGERATITFTFRRSPPPRLVVQVVQEVVGPGDVLRREPISDARVLLKPETIKSWSSPWDKPFQPSQGGIYAKDLEDGPAAGRWDYAVQVPGSEGYVEGKVVVNNDGQPVLIVIKQEPTPVELLVKVVQKDEEGVPKPILGATVILTSAATGKITLQPDEDGAGIYYKELDAGLLAGTWEAEVRHADLIEPHKETIEIDPDNMPYVIVLKPEPPPAGVLVKVISKDEVGISTPILGATVYVRGAAMERPIKLQQLEGDKDGMYAVDLEQSPAAGLWDWSVKRQGSEEFVRGKVEITPGQPAEIVIKTGIEPPKPLGPTILVVRVWQSPASKKNGDRPNVPFIVQIENQTEGKKFPFRRMKQKNREFEEELEPGKYQVAATAPTLAQTWNREIDLKKGHRFTLDLFLDGSKPDVIDIENPGDKPDPGPRVGGLSVKVFEQQNGGGREPIPGATLFLRKGQAGELITVKTDANGEYFNDGLEAGQWQVAARIGESRPAIQQVAVAVGELAECEIIMPSELPQPRPGSLSVLVLTQDDEPIAGATVFLKRAEAGNWNQEKTDADGDYMFEQLEAGQWQVAAGIGKSTSQVQPVTVKAGRLAECKIVIQRERPQPQLGSLLVTVLTQDDEPISGATVSLRKREAGELNSGQTDADGDYYTDGLAAGQWLVTARFDGSTSPPRQVTVTAGRGVECEIIIQRERPQPLPGSLLVAVVTQEGVPIRRNATVWIRSLPGGTWAQMDQNENGDYYQKALPPGQWEVAAQFPFAKVRSRNQQIAVQSGRQANCRIIMPSQQPEPPQPEPPIRNTGIPAALVGSWNVRVFEGQGDGVGTIIAAVKVNRDGTFQLQAVDGQAMVGRLALTNPNSIQMSLNDGSRDNLPFQPLANGRFRVGEEIWERPDGNRPAPEPNQAIPKELVGAWNIRIFQANDEAGQIAATINVNRDGTFQLQSLDGQATAGQLAFAGENVLQMSSNGQRVNHQIQPLANGSFRVGDTIWERPGRNQEIRPPRPPVPGPEQPDMNQGIPAELVGLWNIRAFEGEGDRVGYIAGTINVSRDGTFVTQSQQGRKQGRLNTVGGHLRLLYSNGERALLPFGAANGGGLQVGNQIWERPARDQQIPQRQPYAPPILR